MPDLSSLGATSLGVWTRPQALRLLRPGQIDELVRTRCWQVLWRGVYVDGGSAPTPQQRAYAAVLATTPPQQDRLVVAAGRTAARLHGLPLIDDDDPATGAQEHLVDQVLVDRWLPCQRFGGRVLQPSTVRLRHDDVVRGTSGVRATSCARTLLDCARVLTAEALVCAVDDALRRRLVTRGELEATAARAVNGARVLRAALQQADGRAEAPSETLARLALLPQLPRLVPQVQLFDAAGRVAARFDLADEGVRLAVEVDGKRGHAGELMVAKDRRRDRVAEQLGWTVERVTWWELRREQAGVVRRVAQRHAQLLRPAAA